MDAYVSGGEVQITLDLRDLEDLLVDLQEMQAQINYYRSMRAVNDSGTYDLEPRTQDFVDMLYEKGLKG